MNATFFSPAMPFAMRAEETNRPARYHRGHLDTDWQKDLIYPFQVDARYFQPVELGDPFRFQVKITPASSFTLILYGCDGMPVYTFVHTDSEAVASDVSIDGTQFTAYQYSYDLTALPTGGAPLSLPEGTYYLRLTVDYGSSVIRHSISEPIDVRERHEGTVLIEYNHSSYKYGIPFASIPSKFWKRIRGFVDAYTPKSISTVYQDQNSDTQTLEYSPFRAWRLFVGQSMDDSSGVADWELDKLNVILGCDTIAIDGKRFAPSSANPAWNIETSQTTPLKVADVEIQEAVANEDFTLLDGVIILYEQPSYPYAIGSIIIDSINPVISNTVVGDSTAQTAAIAAMNANISDTELSGTITLVGTHIQYNLAPGESYATAQAIIHTERIFFLLTTVASIPTLPMTIGRGNTMITWGDAAVNSYSVFASNLDITHIYSGAGTYTVTIWGKPDVLIISNNELDYVFGNWPTGLTQLYLSGVGFPSNTFVFSSLANCSDTLNVLSITDAGLTAATGFNSQNMPVLAAINFSNNPFNTTVKSAFHYDVWLNAANNFLYFGSFTIQQTPYVPLNALGLNYKSILQGSPFYWTVNS